jgi:acyl-[acyl-carrier-protein]-phospholipid O-acyltransferase/long-chain-fatty-acid--[acyl-carrier-protein] ligase
MSLHASANLKSRTYIGLILAQFLAAFNDQAIHIVAIFYAGDMLVRYVGLHFGHWHVDDKAIISVVTACFIAPFFFFSTLAGMLADKYSKRTILVLWKLAEVAMMGLALVGFLLPHLAGTGLAASETLALWSAVLVVSVVFLMGTHSAFFVPAKYGVMPEILQATVLSRGNGFLEGTSFVAQILGTAGGGFLYANLKSTISPQGSGHALELGSEWLIGLLLLGFAIIGAIASFMMVPIPAAAPERPLTWKLWQPLQANIGVLLRSRPLALAVLGIAFFTFITLFARQTLLYNGETAKELQAAYRLRDAADKKVVANTADDPGDLDLAPPGASPAQNAELKVALLIALIGLGIGIGSPLAGALSGNKVELGLVPLGTVFLIFFTALMAYVLQWAWPRALCLVLVGVAASFYIVPLYTLLQHRAPKDSKGNLVAMSNFINVAGGLLAVAVFYLVTFGLEALLGLNLDETNVLQDPTLLEQYIQELEKQMQLPRILFLVLSLMIAGMLFLLCRKLPDFFVRALLWLRSHGRYRLKVVGLHNLPSEGPVILATNCDRFDSCMQVVTATDRFTRFILLEHDDDEHPPWLLRYLARRTGLVPLHSHGTPQEAWDKALAKAARALGEGNLLGVTADGDGPVPEMVKLLDQLRALTPAPILPVYCGSLSPQPDHEGRVSVVRRVRVVIGPPLPPGATPAEIRQAIHLLGEWIHQTEQTGAPAVSTAMIPGAAGASPTKRATDHPAHP